MSISQKTFSMLVILNAVLAFGTAVAQAKKPDNPGGAGGGGSGGSGGDELSYTIVPFAPFDLQGTRARIDGLNQNGTAAVGHATLPDGETRSALFDIATQTYTTYRVGVGLGGINDLNQMVGAIGDNLATAAYWDDPMADPITLPPLAGDGASWATGINDNGIVVGYSGANSSSGTSVIWRVTRDNLSNLVVDGPLPLPSLLGGVRSSAGVVSELSEGAALVAGTSYSAPHREAALWTIHLDESGKLVQPSIPQALGTLNLNDPSWSSGISLNNGGDVVGYSDNHPFFAAAGETVGPLPETSKTVNGGIAGDINDSDEIVGNLRIKEDVFSATLGIDHATLWKDGETIDLYSLVGRKSGWTRLWDATKISNTGVIAGYGYFDDERGFLMIPNSALSTSAVAVPELSTLLIAIVGGAILLAASEHGRMRVVFGLAAIVGMITAAEGAEFIPLGPAERAEGVSRDGSAVAGSLFNPTGAAMRWTQDLGWQQLGDLPGGGPDSLAYAVSGDGAVVVGHSESTDQNEEAFRWSELTGMVGLGALPGADNSRAYDVSLNGSVVVGYSSLASVNFSDEAFRWSDSEGMVGLGTLPGHEYSQAVGISADGSHVAGSSVDIVDGHHNWQAFRWTQTDGMQPLGDLPGGSTDSEAYDISADGTTVIGVSGSANGFEAFRWTAASGMFGLGKVDAADFASVAFALSADGSVIVGERRPTQLGPTEAIIWDETNGIRRVQDVLAAAGLDLTGWTLSHATDVSADGNVVVGWGRNPAGTDEAWLARFTTVPEPSTFVLVTIAVAGLAIPAKPRRRSRHL